MAKPDCDDGWYMLAHELDEALSCADFTKAARMVIREVFAQIYGPAKRKVAKVSGSEMGRRWGRDRQYFDRGIVEAVDSLALERDGKGFRFVKDYEKWVIKPRKKGDPVIPRFSKTEISAIDAAPEHAMYFKTEDARSHHRSMHDNQTDDKTVTTKLMTPTTDKQESDNQNDDSMTTILPQNDNQNDDNVTTRMMTNGKPFVEERANGELETRKLGEGDISRSPILEPEPIQTGLPPRTHEDLADVRKASKILMEHQSCQGIAGRLDNEHGLPGNRPLEGWRFIVAARVMVGSKPTESQRKSFDWFLTCARNADISELNPKPATNGKPSTTKPPAPEPEYVKAPKGFTYAPPEKGNR